MAAAPSNLRVNEPVHGQAKVDVLCASTVFVQLSRWEGQSVSLAEALYTGLPVAVSAEASRTLDVERHGVGLVLDNDPVHAARQLREALADPARLESWSKQARVFAQEHHDPDVVSARYVEIYASGTETGDSA